MKVDLNIHALVGIGLYTPAEASRITGVPSQKIVRWLKGHEIKGNRYEPLWKPQIDLDDDATYLGFRDLMEVRVADAFIRWGLSAQRVRLVIDRARQMLGDAHPLSTNRFKTDGRTVFLEITEDDNDPKLIDLAHGQWTMHSIVAPFLRQVDFGENGAPLRWWPLGKAQRIVVDPQRSFGQPVDATSGVPSAVLAAAAQAEGSIEAAATPWKVGIGSIRRALAFEREISLRDTAKM